MGPGAKAAPRPGRPWGLKFCQGQPLVKIVKVAQRCGWESDGKKFDQALDRKSGIGYKHCCRWREKKDCEKEPLDSDVDMVIL
jgi:hypothetical protein